LTLVVCSMRHFPFRSALIDAHLLSFCVHPGECHGLLQVYERAIFASEVRSVSRRLVLVELIIYLRL
jgi:hypothetical protein